MAPSVPGNDACAGSAKTAPAATDAARVVTRNSALRVTAGMVPPGYGRRRGGAGGIGVLANVGPLARRAQGTWVPASVTLSARTGAGRAGAGGPEAPRPAARSAGSPCGG